MWGVKNLQAVRTLSHPPSLDMKNRGINKHDSALARKHVISKNKTGLKIPLQEQKPVLVSNVVLPLSLQTHRLFNSHTRQETNARRPRKEGREGETQER